MKLSKDLFVNCFGIGIINTIVFRDDHHSAMREGFSLAGFSPERIFVSEYGPLAGPNFFFSFITAEGSAYYCDLIQDKQGKYWVADLEFEFRIADTNALGTSTVNTEVVALVIDSMGWSWAMDCLSEFDKQRIKLHAEFGDDFAISQFSRRFVDFAGNWFRRKFDEYVKTKGGTLR